MLKGDCQHCGIWQFGVTLSGEWNMGVGMIHDSQFIYNNKQVKYILFIDNLLRENTIIIQFYYYNLITGVTL